MKRWLGGKRGGLISFVIIAGLVAGGLGWATAAALRLEQEQLEARAQDQLNARLRVALWRLDSRIWPALAKEDSRPYNDYSAVSTPPLALCNNGKQYPPAVIVLLSPLLNAELPDWMLLHFRVGEIEQQNKPGPAGCWGSPQVLSQSLKLHLNNAQVKVNLSNVTPERGRLLKELSRQLTPQTLLALIQQRGADLTLTDTAVVPAANPAEKYVSPPGPIAQTVNPEGSSAIPQTGPAPQQSAAGSSGKNPGGQQPSQSNLTRPRGGNSAANAQSATQNTDQKQLLENEYFNRLNVRSDSQKEVQTKSQQDLWSVAEVNTIRNGEGLFSRSPLRLARMQQTVVNLGPMVPIWLLAEEQPQRLIVARLVQIGDQQLGQGIVLDWPRLQALLAEVVSEEFPEAEFEPEPEYPPLYPERTMTALPIRMNPGPLEAEPDAPTWTPLRIGLALAWTAALIALLAVGLGGWSLIDLSQRRIRFVSAVTHELRTPLTTLRLYLDMLTGGLVQDESQKAEYLQTLNSESDRLNRLVGNVLDFSRLENQRPRLEKSQVVLEDLLDQVRTTWEGRCRTAGKELVIENALSNETILFTDVQLVQQVLGNLIDNACKYSQVAEDRRIWLRARAREPQRLVLEVEDHGPGVPTGERRSIFRPFRRGRGADVTAGGVGLGLALAQRWAQLLGGTLTLASLGQDQLGACFQFTLPFHSGD